MLSVMEGLVGGSGDCGITPHDPSNAAFRAKNTTHSPPRSDRFTHDNITPGTTLPYQPKLRLKLIDA